MPVQTTASAGCQWFHIGELGAENGATQSDACDTCDDDEALDEHQRWWLDTDVVKDPTAEQTQAEAVDEQHFSLNTLDAFEGGGQNVLVNSGAEFGGRTPLSTLAGTVDVDVQLDVQVHGGEEAHSIVGLGIPSCSVGCQGGGQNVLVPSCAEFEGRTPLSAPLTFGGDLLEEQQVPEVLELHCGGDAIVEQLVPVDVDFLA